MALLTLTIYRIDINGQDWPTFVNKFQYINRKWILCTEGYL